MEESALPMCRFFLQGFCKYGDRCRFQHGSNASYDQDEWTNGNYPTNRRQERFNNGHTAQYRDDYRTSWTSGDHYTQRTSLSGVGDHQQWSAQSGAEEGQVREVLEVEALLEHLVYPFTSCALFPDLQDVSPDELRYQALLAQDDDWPSYVQHYRNLVKQNRRQQLEHVAFAKKNPEMIRQHVSRSGYTGQPLNTWSSSGLAQTSAKGLSTAASLCSETLVNASQDIQTTRLFGKSSALHADILATETTDPLYSPLSTLSADEHDSFKATSFTYIPIKLPPRELC